jgi:hypothetical protein
MKLAELIRELQRMRECGCEEVEVLVLAQRAGRIYQVAAVDRPNYRTPGADAGVAVLTIAPAR